MFAQKIGINNTSIPYSSHSAALSSEFEMASAKVFVLAIAFLAVQAQAYPQTPVEGPIIDIITKLLPIIKDLVDWLNNAIDKAIDDFGKDAEKVRAEFIERAGKVLDIILDLTNQALDKAKGKADPATAKILTCVQASRDASKKVTLDFLDNTSKCIVPELGDVLQLVKGLRPDLDKLNDQLYTAAKGIEKCTGDTWEATKCALGVVEDLLKVITDTRPEVVEKLKGLIESTRKALEKVYPTCIRPNVGKLVQERAAVITSVAKCIAA